MNKYLEVILLMGLALVLYLFGFWLQSVIFQFTEHLPGINWFYLPAGLRVVLVFVMGLPAAFGIGTASLLIDVYYYPEFSSSKLLLTAIASGFSPWVVLFFLRRLKAGWAQPLDLAGLQTLVNRVTDHYRESGYPFARAFLLPGSLSDAGELTIHVVEGRYGQVVALSPDEAIAKGSTPFLSALKTGDVVTTDPLERATLLLHDLPGYTATPVMKPGAGIGTGDLSVLMETDKRVQGGVGIDNHGSIYSGEFRWQSNLAISRVALFGDELALSAIAPIEGTWMGAANYAIPLGAHGARMSVGITRTGYTLSGDFVGFSGTATEKALGASYPLVRSRSKNLSVSLSYKDRNLRDDRLGAVDEKHVTTRPLVFNFDRRDSLGLGGITYGAFSLIRGSVKDAGSKTDFARWQADVVRLQRVSSTWNLYARSVVQGARDNLDSSEGFSIGGATGVRAYPSGEASGDEGWLVQLEARKSLGAAELYAFYDHGHVKVDARPELVSSPAPDQERAGAGVGIRVSEGPVKVNVALAWRSTGGAPTSEASAGSAPRMWMSMMYSF